MCKETMNIGKTMRANSDLNISKAAIKELISFLEANFEEIMTDLDDIAKEDGCKTVLKRHIVHYFSLR